MLFDNEPSDGIVHDTELTYPCCCCCYFCCRLANKIHFWKSLKVFVVNYLYCSCLLVVQQHVCREIGEVLGSFTFHMVVHTSQLWNKFYLHINK